MKHAAGNSREIEQVVDQSRLQLHVALYDLDIFGELWRKFVGVLLKVRGCCQSRCQWRPQFMAERCQKIILGLACFLRCNFFCFKLTAAYLVGNVACDFGKTANLAAFISKRSDDKLCFES